MGTQANVLTPQQMRCIYALARGGGISNDDLHAVVFATTGKDSMKLMVLGNDDRIELVSLFDNLGKGSSGAAIECLNLMTGAPETTGLNL